MTPGLRSTGDASAPTAQGSRHWILACALALLIALPSSASAGSLPNAPALARCYQAILDARFDDAEIEIGRTCGPAPKETCGLMRATAAWWRIQLDPGDKSRDAAFRSQADAVIASAEAWAAREPKRADAWFFVGASYGLRVVFRALRGERLSAARDGKQAKDALERSLTLDPSLQDAYFGIGLYRYYADIVPAALKFFRWILLMPGGNKVEGLQQMQRTRERGELLRGEADFQLAWVYLWYEQKPDEGLKLLEGLRVTYPHNPLFVQSIAEVQDEYRHDDAASLEAWRALLALARDRKVALPESNEALARLGIALRLDGFAETDTAIEELQAIVESRTSAPYGATALARYRLGAAFDRMGWRDRAVASYKAAIASAPADDPDEVRTKARDAIARTPDPKTTEAYRLSLEGYRQLQRKDLARAAESLSRSATLNPADPLTRYRQALLLAARGRQAEALAEFERVIAMRPVPPAFVIASSAVEAGRLLEAAGDRARAIEQYTRASRLRGADAAAQQAAVQALERLRVPQSTR